MIPRFDLVVRGGTIVTPGHREIADLGERDGRIARIGGAMSDKGEVGAHGLLGAPGPPGTGSLPEQLRAIDVQVGGHGTIWAHYEVVAR
jgi:hypothetical protein